MEELGFVQCQRDRHIPPWRLGSPDWAICAFWVDDETGVGSRAARTGCIDVQPEARDIR